MGARQVVGTAVAAAVAVVGIGSSDEAVDAALERYDEHVVVGDAKRVGDSITHRYLLNTFVLPQRLTPAGEAGFEELPGLTHSGKNSFVYEVVNHDSYTLTVTGSTGVVVVYESDRGGITEIASAAAPDPEPLDAGTQAVLVEAEELVTETPDQGFLADLAEAYVAAWDAAVGALP